MIALEQEIRETVRREGEFVDRISRSIIIGTDDAKFVPGDTRFVPF